jgi:hypothetical protein
VTKKKKQISRINGPISEKQADLNTKDWILSIDFSK